MLSADASSPVAVNSRLSDDTNAPPDADSTAPPVFAELLQPRSGPLGGLLHGQETTWSSPGLHQLVKFGPPVRSRTKMSNRLFVSPRSKSEATLENDTYRPSAEIHGYMLCPLPSIPADPTLARSVVPSRRSRTNTS